MTSGYRASAASPARRKKPRLVAKPRYWPAHIFGISTLGVFIVFGFSVMGSSNYDHEKMLVLAQGILYAELLAVVAGVSSYVWFGTTWQLLPPSRRVAENGRPLSPAIVWALQLVPFVNFFFTWYLAKQIRSAYNEMVEEYRRSHRIRQTPMQLAFGLPFVGMLLVGLAGLTTDDPALCKAFLGSGGATLFGAFAALLRFMFVVDKAKSLIAVAAPGSADVLR